MTKALIIGGGSWGLAIANLIAGNGGDVTVWEYNPEFVKEIKQTGFNSTLLPEVMIDKRIKISADMKEAFICQPEILMFAVPSHAMRSVAIRAREQISTANTIKSIVCLAKGIEEGSMKRMSEVLTEELPVFLTEKISALSGPSHAEEVAKGIPTTVTLAGYNEESLSFCQNLLSNDYFRVYTSSDIIGVEFGGAIKNIIAIAAGIIDGLGLGDNTMGALLTRGLAEIRRLGVKLDADPNTFNGLSGIGDLITTAISKHSRNRYVGFNLGIGRKLDDILASMTMVAEGVRTAKSIFLLSNKLKVSMPITAEVYNILFKDKAPREAIQDLMTRELKEED